MEDFAEYLTNEMGEHGWDQSELSRRSGVTTSQISRVINRESRPGIDFCRKIAHALGVRDIDVARMAGLVDSEPEINQYPVPIRNTIRYMQEMDEKDQADVEALVHALRMRRARVLKPRGGLKP